MKVFLLLMFLGQFAVYGQKVVLSDELDEDSRQKLRENYDDQLKKLEEFRVAKKASYRSATAAQKKKILLEVRTRLENDLCENVFPAWYGTPWDFNGISKTPGKGKVACGYFVSTCLVQVGFKVPRIKLAQQPSQRIIKTFVPRKEMDISSQRTLEKLKIQLLKTGNGIYIVGLDTHVGFVVVNGEDISFVHSSYYRPERSVVAEKYDSKNPLADSKYRVFGKIFHDAMLVKWLNGEAYSVVK